MSNTASTDNSTQAAKAANTGRAVLLLALFVTLGVLLLNAIDDQSADNVAALRPAPVEEVAPPALVAPTTVPSRLPSDVKVLVANGVGVDGAASRVASRLQPIGYLLVTPGNTTTPSPAGGVAYTQGFEAEARALATSLNLPVESVRPLDPALVSDLQGANVVVIVGNELANAPGAPGAAGTPAAGAAGATGAATTGSSSANTTATSVVSGAGVAPTAVQTN